VSQPFAHQQENYWRNCKRNSNIALVVANIPYRNDKAIGARRVHRSGNHENRGEE